MSNLSTIINNNQSNLKGAAFHYKMYSIVLFALSGLLFLGGTILCITIIGILAGLIYIGMGVLFIFLGRYLLQASKSLSNIVNVSELTQDDYNTNSANAIVNTKSYFKAMNIIFVVEMCFLIIGLIIAAFALPSIINSINQMDRSNNPMTGNPNYKSNPYQTQSNKSQTAGQMGMSDKEHSEMHDPKNIVNTDYSQLDYSNSPDELKASQDAVKNASDKMTPEQKAAMEKMMGEIKK